MNDFFSYERPHLAQTLSKHGIARQHADLLFKRAYRFFPKTRSSQVLRELPFPKKGIELLGHFPLQLLEIVQYEASRYDGTVKFQLACQDGSKIEAVLIPEQKRLTLCVSSQVGCAQACVFCHTGKMGLKRNLTAGEIVNQLVTVTSWIHTTNYLSQLRERYPELRSNQGISNVVFMGMGEPLDNYTAVVSACKIMMDPLGLGIAQRKISVSTAGFFEKWDQLLDELPQISLAISLHAAQDRLRSQLMPINKLWNLSVLKSAISHVNHLGRSVLIQYTLFSGINDRLEDVDNLAAFLEGLNVKINIIPYNTVEGLRLSSPDPEQVVKFCDRLRKAGFRVLVRFSKGQDIGGACGQLFVKPKINLIEKEANA